MKKIFTLLFVMSALFVNAQSISVLYNGTPLGENDTVFAAVDGHADQTDVFFGYQNNTSSPVEFKVRKEIVFIPEDADMMFCLGDCYSGNLSQAQTLDANQAVASDNALAFHTIYSGSLEAALVKYTFFLTNNETDHISFYIAYATGSSVKPAVMLEALHAYPNPATRMVNIDYFAPSANSFLVIKNLTGKEVFRAAVSQAGKRQVDISQFNAGVYLYGVESDGRMLCTKKLLVK